MTQNPKVFISYAWEDDTKTWVKKLAEDLRSNGVNVIIDQWELRPGDRLLHFMETSISQSDYVLIVCTPKYKIKADCREGGAGFEGDIISSEQYYKDNPRKFIPLLKKGEWKDAAPVFLQYKTYIDFRSAKKKKESYQHLLRTLFDDLPKPPPLGDTPQFSPNSFRGLKKKLIFIITFILLLGIGFSIYYISNLMWNIKNMQATRLYDTPLKFPEEEYTIEITTGYDFSAKIGDTVSIPVVFQLSELHRKDVTPYVLYIAYLEDGIWQKIHSEYLSGDTTEKMIQIETGTLDLPPGSYIFTIAIFSSANFSQGASLTEIPFELVLTEDEDNPNEPYTIGGKLYDKDSTELILTGISNQGLKKLPNFTKLISLQIISDDLTNISPLAEMTSLKRLFIYSTSLENIEPLKNMTNLTHLGLGGVNDNGPGCSGDLYDITPISVLTNLESLTIKDCQVSDISVVRNMSELKTLWVYKTKVSDLSPVAELVNLTDLRVHRNQIEDIRCLEGLRKLEYLAISYNFFSPQQVDELKEIIPDCVIINN